MIAAGIRLPAIFRTKQNAQVMNQVVEHARSPAMKPMFEGHIFDCVCAEHGIKRAD